MKQDDQTTAAVRGSELSAELGPEERAKLDALLDHIHEYGTTAEGVLRLAAHLCQSVRAAERERCASAVREAAEGYRATAWGKAAECIGDACIAAIRRA